MTCSLCCRKGLDPSDGSSRKRRDRLVWVCHECQKYVMDLAQLSLKKGFTIEPGQDHKMVKR
jgi:hypothetical protein